MGFDRSVGQIELAADLFGREPSGRQNGNFPFTCAQADDGPFAGQIGKGPDAGFERIIRRERPSANTTPEQLSIQTPHDPLIIVQAIRRFTQFEHLAYAIVVFSAGIEVGNGAVQEVRSLGTKGGGELPVAPADYPVVQNGKSQRRMVKGKIGNRVGV